MVGKLTVSWDGVIVLDRLFQYRTPLNQPLLSSIRCKPSVHSSSSQTFNPRECNHRIRTIVSDVDQVLDLGVVKLKGGRRQQRRSGRTSLSLFPRLHTKRTQMGNFSLRLWVEVS
jgi:hypothetical protein